MLTLTHIAGFGGTGGGGGGPPDVTAPILSSATGTETSDTTADLSVSTDEANGTLYWVVTQSATDPTKAQVKAGEDDNGDPADDSGSQAVSGTGVQNITGGATGLTAATEYFAHFMHEDDATNQSDVATSSAFETDPAVPVVTYRGPIATSGDTIAIGDAAADRLVVAVVHHIRSVAAGRSLTLITIAGTNGIIHAQVGANVNSGAGVGIGSRTVTTGTTATIAWTLDGVVASARAEVYTITGLISTTPHDTGTANGNDPTASLDLAAVGVLIAGATNSGDNVITLTGVDTQDADADVAGVAGRSASGHSENTSTTSNHSVSPTSAAANEVVAAVSWA